MLSKLSEKRIIRSVYKNIQRMQLDLSGCTVVTECATGVYACTPIIALLAGAKKVVAYGQDSKYGSFVEAKRALKALLENFQINYERLVLINKKNILLQHLRSVDIITNSGYLRPLNKEKLFFVQRKSIIALMYESWELREEDIDIDYCREKSIAVIGTNEQQSKAKIFEFLGPIIIKALLEKGMEVIGNKVLLVCDNAFASYIKKSLEQFQAEVLMASHKKKYSDIDVIVFAQTPKSMGGNLQLDSLNLPTNVDVCCQFWGEVSRENFQTQWIPYVSPHENHMGLLLTHLGVEPLVRLQTASLKAAQDFKENKKVTKNSFHRIVV